MNTYPTTLDLVNTLRLLKQEDQKDLLEYIRHRYSNSFEVTERYRNNALSQIRSALKQSIEFESANIEVEAQ